jgi:hypothetical protein
MIQLTLLLSILFPVLLQAQDVFASGDKPSPATLRRDPCKELSSSGGCATFYYNVNDKDGLKNAQKQCTTFIKNCPKKPGGCNCWTLEDGTPLNGSKIDLRDRTVMPGPNKPISAGTSTQRNDDTPPPPGQRIIPQNLGPRLTASLRDGKCKTTLHNQRDHYLNCPGYVPDLVNDNLQKDSNSPDPNPSPIKLYGSVSTSNEPLPNSSDKGNGNGSRFGAGNINDADPPLLITAKILEGIDDCLKANLTSDIGMLPLAFATQRYRGLKSIMTAFGVLGNVNNLAHDINASLAPGQSLGDRSYEIGKLLCEGYSLGDAIRPRPGAPGYQNAEPLSLEPIRPITRKPTPTYKDPEVKTALERGIPLVDHKALQGLAQTNGWNIAIRDSSPYAMRWVGHPNAVPKPVDVKAKTLKPNGSIAQSRANDPYFGLASAQGMNSGELSLLRLKGYTVDDPSKGFLLRNPEGKWMYSDIDIHGLYDKAGNNIWPTTKAGENALIDGLNGSTLERMFQHGPQDTYLRRDDPSGPSFGPQPPATIYTHDGRVIFVSNSSDLEAAYTQLGINFKAIYPRPLAQYPKP